MQKIHFTLFPFLRIRWRLSYIVRKYNETMNVKVRLGDWGQSDLSLISCISHGGRWNAWKDHPNHANQLGLELSQPSWHPGSEALSLRQSGLCPLTSWRWGRKMCLVLRGPQWSYSSYLIGSRECQVQWRAPWWWAGACQVATSGVWVVRRR